MQENPEVNERSEKKKPETTAEDQAEHPYYYDDAHGYEEYDPEADEEDGGGTLMSP